MAIRPNAVERGSPLQTLLWGLFCANSWTWCIGMYLPVLMIDHFGWWGFIAFAVPNVIGGTGMGYLIRTRQRSQAMVATHGQAMTWFSIITVACHSFFVVFLFHQLDMGHWQGAAWAPLAVAFVVYALGVIFSFLDNRDWLGLTALAFALAIVALCATGFDGLARIRWRGADDNLTLLWVAPTLLFGFLLCPHLDLTFHRAIQRSPSRHAFAVFGVAFMMMLVLTCTIWFGPAHVASQIAAIGVVHIIVQCIFTVGAHLREVRLSPAIRNPALRILALLGPGFAAFILPLARIYADSVETGEAMYLRWLAFYGLVFPSYVLLAMARPTALRGLRSGRLLWWMLLLASLPLYELGFLHGKPWLLVPPVAVLLAWAVIVPMYRRAQQKRRTLEVKAPE